MRFSKKVIEKTFCQKLQFSGKKWKFLSENWCCVCNLAVVSSIDLKSLVLVFILIIWTAEIIKDAYSYPESIKKLKYEQRITEIEQSSFVPLIFSCTGGAGPKATNTIQKLAEKLSNNRNDTYQETINYSRTTISFALLRSGILCLSDNTKSKTLLAW